MTNATQNTSESSSEILRKFPTSAPYETESFWNELGHIANVDKWILFTAECIRPTTYRLDAFNIPSTKVIQLKPSQLKNEIEVVMQAILSGNASAVIASDNIDYVTQQQLKDLARIEGCQVFFTDNSNACKLH